MNLLWPMDPPYQSIDALHTTTHSLADEPTLAYGPPSIRAEMPWIPVHKTLADKPYFWPMVPQYQSRDALNTSTQNLADEPTWPMDPPSIRAEMHWIPVHKTWHMNLLWSMDPPPPQYQSRDAMRIPQYQSRDALNTSTQNLADEPTLANGPPSPSIPEQRCHEDPPVPEQRCLEYQYTKLGRWTYFGQWTPQVPKQRCLEYQYTKLGRWTYFGQWAPQYQSRDALNTSTQNLADDPTLANGPPSTRAEMPWIPVHKTWQMNLFLANGPTKYQSRDALNTSTQTLADEPTLANGPPSTKAEMPWIPVNTTWQINLLWPMDPQSTRAEMHWIPVHKTWQMNLLWPMDPPSTRAEMPWIPVHKTWQMNLLCQMGPPVPKQKCLEYPQNLADEPTLANGPPKVTKQRCLHTATDI